MRKSRIHNQYAFEPFTLGCIFIVIVVLIIAAISNSARKQQQDKGIISPADISSTDVILTDRTEKPIGTERRVIDNSDGDISITREVKVTSEWTREYSIDYENSASTKVDVKHSLIVISAAAEAELTAKFSTSQTTRETKIFSDSFTIQIPARTRSILLLEWKQVWQNGKIKVTTQNGGEVLVPFSVLLNLTYDSKSL